MSYYLYAALVLTSEISTCVLSHVQLFATLWTAAPQAPLSMGFPRQEYWSGLPFTPPGDLPDPGIKPTSPVSPALQVDSLPLSHQGSLWNKANAKYYSSNLNVFLTLIFSIFPSLLLSFPSLNFSFIFCRKRNCLNHYHTFRFHQPGTLDVNAYRVSLMLLTSLAFLLIQSLPFS